MTRMLPLTLVVISTAPSLVRGAEAGAVIAGANAAVAPAAAPDTGETPAAPRSATPDARTSNWAELPRLGNVKTALVYARMAKMPIAYEEILYAYEDATGLNGEFQRREKFAELRARIDRENEVVRGAKTFVISTAVTLPTYDFQRGGFSTPVGDSFIDLNGAVTRMKGPPYAVTFANGSDASFIRVAEDAARVAVERDVTRQAHVDLEVEPVSAKTRVLRPMGSPTRVLAVRIVRARLVAHEDVLGTIELPQAERKAGRVARTRGSAK